MLVKWNPGEIPRSGNNAQSSVNQSDQLCYYTYKTKWSWHITCNSLASTLRLRYIAQRSHMVGIKSLRTSKTMKVNGAMVLCTQNSIFWFFPFISCDISPHNYCKPSYQTHKIFYQHYCFAWYVLVRFYSTTYMIISYPPFPNFRELFIFSWHFFSIVKPYTMCVYIVTDTWVGHLHVT